MAPQLWSLVNRYNQEVGSTTSDQLRSIVSHNAGLFLRTSCVLLRNPAREIWTPRRVEGVQIAPGGLDFAMAKHAKPLEKDIETAYRGLQEELNIDDAPELTPMGTLPPMLERRSPYFSAIYVYDGDGSEPNYSRENFTSGEWLTIEALLDRLHSGEPAKSLLAPALQLVQLVEGRS